MQPSALSKMLLPTASGAQNVRLGVPDLSRQQRDWLADILSDPVKGAAFWVLAPAVPFVFGAIGFVLIALPFVARLFTGGSSDTSVEQIQSQLAKSCEEVKSRLRRAVNDRVDSISTSVFDIFDESQERIRICCRAINGEEAIDRGKLQSLKVAAATLQSEIAETMNAIIGRNDNADRADLAGTATELNEPSDRVLHDKTFLRTKSGSAIGKGPYGNHRGCRLDSEFGKSAHCNSGGRRFSFYSHRETQPRYRR